MTSFDLSSRLERSHLIHSTESGEASAVVDAYNGADFSHINFTLRHPWRDHVAAGATHSNGTLYFAIGGGTYDTPRSLSSFTHLSGESLEAWWRRVMSWNCGPTPQAAASSSTRR